MAMLMEHMAAKGLMVSDTDELLFTAPHGGQLRYNNWLRRVWYPACATAGLGRMVEDEDTGKKRYAGLDFHDLRRNTGTGLVAAGVDPKTAQEILGHSAVRLTLEIYARAVPDRVKAAADAMGARFVPVQAREGRAMNERERRARESGERRDDHPGQGG
jgi:integrase